jgi:hypothetical protein
MSDQVKQPPSLEAKHRQRAALFGGLLVAWCLAWSAAYLAAVAVLQVRVGLPVLTLDQIDRLTALSAPLPLMGGLLLALIIAVGAGSIGGYCLAALGQWMRLDPAQQSRQVLLRVLLHERPPRVFFSVAASGFLALCVLSAHFPDFAFSVMVVGALLLLTTAPFLVWQRAFLIDQQSRPTLHNVWPGWRALAVVAILLVIHGACSLATDFLFFGVSMGWLLALGLDTLIPALVFTLVSAVWIDRLSLRALWRRRDQLLARSAWGPFVALQVRCSVVWLWLLVPAIAIILIQRDLVPNAVALAHGRAFLPPLLFLSEFVSTLMSCWWLAATWLLPIYLLILGRLYVMLFPQPISEIASIGAGPQSSSASTIT